MLKSSAADRLFESKKKSPIGHHFHAIKEAIEVLKIGKGSIQVPFEGEKEVAEMSRSA